MHRLFDFMIKTESNFHLEVYSYEYCTNDSEKK